MITSYLTHLIELVCTRHHVPSGSPTMLDFYSLYSSFTVGIRVNTSARMDDQYFYTLEQTTPINETDSGLGLYMYCCARKCNSAKTHKSTQNPSVCSLSTSRLSLLCKIKNSGIKTGSINLLQSRGNHTFDMIGMSAMYMYRMEMISTLLL